MSVFAVVFCLFLVFLTGFVTSKHVSLFVFGDSLLDAGNNNYINTTAQNQANFWPYGESYFNPPTGRFSNGRLIPDFIAEYARLPLIPAYLDPSRQKNDFVYGANFASGGAGALVQTHAGSVVSLKTQLEYFGDLANHFRQNLGVTETKQLLSDAVYLFSCGINDYSDIQHPHEEYVEMIIGNLTDVFKGIYEKGGRRFAMVNLPTTACLPMTRAGRKDLSCDQVKDIISRLHNQQLSNKLQELEDQLEGFIYSLFDLYTALSDRMNNPAQYGFKVGGDSACCGSGPFRGEFSCGGTRGVREFELCDKVNDYLIFDSAHPTEKASRQFTKLFWDGDSNLTTPRNLKTLFRD